MAWIYLIIAGIFEWGWPIGPDCSDADIWRENDPVKPTPDGPPPIEN